MNNQRKPLLKSVMTSCPHAIELEASLSIARQFMREHRIRHLPVIQNTKLVGIVTDRDIKLILGPDFAYPRERELRVNDVFIHDPYVVDINEPLDHVLLTLADRHIGSALVTKKAS